jgi:hypothetical protein
MNWLSLLNVRFLLISLTLEMFLENIKWNMDIIWKYTLIKRKKVGATSIGDCCVWEIYASLVLGSKNFMVKSLWDQYSCIRLGNK